MNYRECCEVVDEMKSEGFWAYVNIEQDGEGWANTFKVFAFPQGLNSAFLPSFEVTSRDWRAEVLLRSLK